MGLIQNSDIGKVAEGEHTQTSRVRVIDIMAWATGNYHQTIPMTLKWLENTLEAGSMVARGLNQRVELGSKEGRKAITRTKTTYLRKVACKELLVGFA
jgi:hypothetical protein